MNDCIFCQIVKGEAPSWKIYEDEKVYAFLNIYPAAPYHTLVIPKKHSVNSFDTPEEDLLAIMSAIKKLIGIFTTKLGIQNLQIINSSGAEAQQEVFHTHFHIVPRKAGDGQDFDWTKLSISNDELERMAKTVRAG